MKLVISSSFFAQSFAVWGFIGLLALDRYVGYKSYNFNYLDLATTGLWFTAGMLSGELISGYFWGHDNT